MTQSWRIPIDFSSWMTQIEKRVMRVERRPAITNATQLLGPGAGPYAVLLNDWNDEAGTFNGVFYSEPGAANAPPPTYDEADDTTWRWWIGETFGYQDEDDQRWGTQHLTRARVSGDVGGASPVSWTEYRRRFFSQGGLVAYTAWEAA